MFLDFFVVDDFPQKTPATIASIFGMVLVEMNLWVLLWIISAGELAQGFSIFFLCT